VHVYTASAEIGQGSDTTFAMIAAETIGIPLDSVKISSGDTEFGIDLGAYSSRQTLMTGHATKEAAVDVRRQVLGVLARELKVDISELDIKDGLIVFKHGRVDYSHVRTVQQGAQGMAGSSKRQREPLTFQEAARIAYLARGSIIGKGRYKPPCSGAPTRAPRSAPLRPTGAPPRWLKCTWTWRPVKSPSRR
jgi:CO/xanthine dehydrogenase Mo-binding subunit